MPAGRQPIATLVRPTRARPEIYAYVRAQVAAGRQAYVVCALIEDSDALQAQSAVQLARELSEGWLRGVRVEVLHGRLPGAEKAARMDAFRRGAIDVLVATTVIEVGVDVPNASLMVVEDADRYGLAQLHQLRGRIGRGPVKSHCVLVADPTTDDGRRRLEIIRATADGFRIAQEDLQLRGPGEVLGTRQHGVTELRVANPATDLFLMEDARRAAETVVGEDPHLAGDGLRALEAAVRKQVEGRSRLVSVG
jgi:ATP-dependent DNA helicase RecG